MLSVILCTFAVVACGILWIRWARRVSQSLRVAAPDRSEYDWIVVGAGPGGCAAARRLAELSAGTIALIERGSSRGGTKLEVPSYQPWTLCSALDSGSPMHRPFCENTLFYHQGSGFGGTSQLDLALHIIPTRFGLNSISPKAVDVLAKFFSEKSDAPLRVSLSPSRSPVSWAFVEACSNLGFRRALPPCNKPFDYEAKDCPTVFPFWLHINVETGLKHNMCERLLMGKCPPVEVFLHSVAQRVVVDDATGKASCVDILQYKRGSTQSFQIRASKGIIVSCGLWGTPRLMMNSRLLRAPSTKEIAFYDAVSLPLLYQARPGLTNDSCNIGTWRHMLSYFLRSRGPLLNVVCDSAAVFDLPSGVKILILLIPSGGFSKDVFRNNNISICLGVFREALTFQIVCFPPKGEAFRATLRRSTESAEADVLELHPEHTLIVESLIAGIEQCREIVAAEPLCHLTTGKEALDVTLFPESSQKSAIYRILYAKPPKHITRQVSEAAASLRDQARSIARSSEYLRQYVTKHAQFAGYGCGSLPPSIFDAETHAVSGVKGLYVADASAIPPVTLSEPGGGGTTAMTAILGDVVAEQAMK